MVLNHRYMGIQVGLRGIKKIEAVELGRVRDKYERCSREKWR